MTRTVLDFGCLGHETKTSPTSSSVTQTRCMGQASAGAACRCPEYPAIDQTRSEARDMLCHSSLCLPECQPAASGQQAAAAAAAVSWRWSVQGSKNSAGPSPPPQPRLLAVCRILGEPNIYGTSCGFENSPPRLLRLRPRQGTYLHDRQDEVGPAAAKRLVVG